MPAFQPPAPAHPPRPQFEKESAMQHPPHYDPLQPRVPKGHEGGGRWTRDGNAPVRLAYLAPPTWPIVGQALVDAVTAALGLYSLLSIHNSRRRQAVIEFNAHEYRGQQGVMISKQPRLLDRDNVLEICDRLAQVQSLTDDAVAEARREFIRDGRTNPRPADFGTAVHTKLKRMINGDNPKGYKDINFRAEVSYVKNQEENYGRKDSIRIDVYERRDEQTVCVYDIKTGKAGLSAKRMAEIAAQVLKVYPEARRIIVTEVRPTAPPYRTR
jgi:hypothetical protein